MKTLKTPPKTINCFKNWHKLTKILANKVRVITIKIDVLKFHNIYFPIFNDIPRHPMQTDIYIHIFINHTIM